jgi:GT2 family glycosyltransferase
MASSAKVGVVTVTYNSETVVGPFLDSLLAQDHNNIVVYLVDNDSQDETLVEVAKYRDRRMRVMANADNVGVAAGNNQGIRAALDEGCSHVLLVNNDTEFEASLVTKLLDGMVDLSCEIVVPKSMFFDEPDRVWFGGGGFKRWLAYAPYHVGEGDVDRPFFDISRQIAYAPTCCMLLMAPVFSKVGMMDDLYFVYFDDVDFCYRAGKAAVDIFIIGNVRFFHKVASLTGGAGSDFAARYSTRNKVYFVRKNLNPWFVPLWLAAFQSFLILRLVRDRDWQRFVLKERAFAEGMAIPIGHQLGPS